MSASTAIGMVSESLRNLLVTQMILTPPVAVTILAPDETGGDRRINLFLYRILENATLKNLDWQAKRSAPSRIVPPPLSLNLYYLMTPYAQNDSLTGNATAHEMLGEAMRVFHEHAVVPQTALVQGLRDASEQIKIMLNPLDLDELGRVWSTFSQPFRLSVMYEVSVVQLELHSERPMSKRVQRTGVPDIRAPFRPPVVEQLTPLSGPVGARITVSGQHLAGWPASLSITGNRIIDSSTLTGDTMTATIPAGLAPGFHEIQVDIAHLHRRVFFFEVSV
jgi:Pvc16 N-terminal domain/IPT/TIG domain